MPARRVTTVTVPVGVRSGVALESYRGRTPLLTIWAARPPLLVTLTLPQWIEPGHVALPASSRSSRAGTRPRSSAAGAVFPPRRCLRGWRRDPVQR